MKTISSSSSLTARRGNYLISVAVFILLWGTFGLIGKYRIGWGIKVEYYGSMMLVFAWAMSLRKRMENAGRQMGSLVPYMIGALLLDFVLIKWKLIGLSASVLFGVVLVQLPAMFWQSSPCPRVVEVPKAGGPAIGGKEQP